ncbi:hypothetical protein THAOC_31715, partial [Thalassiosira oceanica]
EYAQGDVDAPPAHAARRRDPRREEPDDGARGVVPEVGPPAAPGLPVPPRPAAAPDAEQAAVDALHRRPVGEGVSTAGMAVGHVTAPVAGGAGVPVRLAGGAPPPAAVRRGRGDRAERAEGGQEQEGGEGPGCPRPPGPDARRPPGHDLRSIGGPDDAIAMPTGGTVQRTDVAPKG